MKNLKAHALSIGLLLLFAGAALAQFPAKHPDGVEMPGGPVAIGQQMMQTDESHPGKVALVQSAPPSGGIIQLSAFGWLEPYVDSVVQALILAGLAALGKSKYTQWMDQSARDALGTFVKNTASSLIADGFVRMKDKTVEVSSAALATEVSTAADRIPDAMKRFGLTPGAVAQKIVDAIPQTPAGAAIVATAHKPPDAPPIADPVTSASLGPDASELKSRDPRNNNPPTSSS